MKSSINKNKINPRQEIIFNLRGFFSTPIISGLSKIGLIDIILKKGLDKIPSKYNKELIKYSLEYLIDLGFLTYKNKKYKPTIFGKKILKRQGSFMLLHSYHEYINNYSKALTNKKIVSKCDRYENITGSGKVHGDKYFKKAVKEINKLYKMKIKNYIDLGCGDGKFLSILNNNVSNSKLIGVDYSDVSVKNTRLIKNKKNNKIFSFKSDAFNLSNIRKNLNKLKIDSSKEIMFSFCFILHELNFEKKNDISKYFDQIIKYYPKAKILICEINKFDSSIISNNKNNTILPEFYFFHKISGQKIFSQKILNYNINISKFTIIKELNYDNLSSSQKNLPSIYFYFLDTKS